MAFNVTIANSFSGAETNHPSPEKTAKVPFLFYEQLQIDSNGLVYTINEHDITVRFPFGVVASGETLQFEIGVTLFGPFKFLDDIRPISPILWLCPLNESISLQKPFQLILPHFLSNNKIHDHEVMFAKSNHGDHEENCYTFRVCDTKPIFASTGSKSYGILETNHCCFHCLEAKITPQIAREAKFVLVRLDSFLKQEIQFCVIYPLNSCLKVCLDLVSIMKYLV